jgi:hypothetical protein
MALNLTLMSPCCQKITCEMYFFVLFIFLRASPIDVQIRAPSFLIVERKV